MSKCESDICKRSHKKKGATGATGATGLVGPEGFGSLEDDAFLKAAQVFRLLDALFSEALTQSGGASSPVFVQAMSDLFTLYLTPNFTYTLNNFDVPNMTGSYNSNTFVGQAAVVAGAATIASTRQALRYTLPPSPNLMNYKLLSNSPLQREVQLYSDINHVVQDRLTPPNTFLQFGKNVQNLVEVEPNQFRSVRAELTNYQQIQIVGPGTSPPQNPLTFNTSQITLIGFNQEALDQPGPITYYYVSVTTLPTTVTITPPPSPLPGPGQVAEIPIFLPSEIWPLAGWTVWIPPGTTSFFIRARSGDINTPFAPILFDSNTELPPGNGSSISYLYSLSGTTATLTQVPNPSFIDA